MASQNIINHSVSGKFTMSNSKEILWNKQINEHTLCCKRLRNDWKLFVDVLTHNRCTRIWCC